MSLTYVIGGEGEGGGVGVLSGTLNAPILELVFLPPHTTKRFYASKPLKIETWVAFRS